MSQESYTQGGARRYRPARRVTNDDDESQPGLLTHDFQGVAAAYGDAQLFLGYEVEGKIEVVVYP
ncbi:MAG: hypothetical protein M3328_00495, partial [Chloroflexota bacterium]|nr:hypothetical protein [Chloroflexota bacterium]